MKTKLTILMLIASVLCVDAQSWTWLEDQLSYAREGLSSAVLDDSIFYSGGRLYNNSFQNTVDIYDIGEDQWSTADLESSGRFISAMVSAGGKMFIAGGNNYPGTENFSDIDVFDKATEEWTIAYLSEDRAVYGGAVACGNKVFFAGGHYHTNGATATAYSNVVDIYDTETNTWSIDYLSVTRGFIGSVAVGNKVYFAGGATGTHAVTNVIDIYDIETEEWTVEYLTEGRAFIAAVAYNDKIYFAGGCKQNSITSTLIEVYDVTTGQWGETMNLQSTRLVFGINVNNALVFSGVCNNVTLSGVIGIGLANGIIEVYYPETGHWDYSIPNLDPARILYSCASYENKVYHAGGWTGQATINNLNILECVAPQIIHVPGDQPTIQAAIEVATHGDTILVDEGTYYENINFKGKAITVASQFLMDGIESHIENTIIDGSQPANPDTASVVSFVSGEDTTSVLCGFTIRNGTGTYDELYDARIGGGINCICSGAKIINNKIIDNHLDHENGTYGGGVEVWDTTALINNYLILRNNTIEDNSCISIEDYPGGTLGGGVDLTGLNCIVENNDINSNTLEGRPYGAGISLTECGGIIRNNNINYNTSTLTIGSCRGGGMYIQNNDPGLTISFNTITYNQINHISGNLDGGGGIAVLNQAGFEYNEIFIDGNIITNNAAKSGGGIFLRRAYYANVSNNVIQENEATNNGGGVTFTHSGKNDEGEGSSLRGYKNSSFKTSKSKGQIPALINNTITDNTAVVYGGGIISTTTAIDFLLVNNIIYDNTAQTSGNAIYLYSNCDAYLYNNDINTDEIAGGGSWEGEGNIFVDPEFDDDGYHLLPGSQCIEAGITEIEIDGDTYYCPDHDIDGQFRPQNAAADIGVDEVLITGIYGGNISQKNSELQISPNPSSGALHLRFTINEQGFTICDLYEISGVKVKGLLNEEKTPGTYELEIDLSDLPNGIYFCVLKTNNGIQTTKIIKL